MNKKIFGWSMIAALTATTLVGCSGSAEPAKEDTASKDGKVTIKFWTTTNTDESKVLETIVADYEAKNQNVDIDLQTVPFSDARNKFKTAAQGGDAPDVFRCEIAWTPELAALGFLEPLDGKISEADKKDFLKAPYNYNVYDGKLWGVPHVTDAPALLYNKRLFAEAGVTEPKTIDEMIAAAKKLTKDGQYGFYINTDSYFLQPFVWAYGGDTITNDKQVKIASPESIKGLEALLKFKEEKTVQANFDFANQYQNMMTDFKEGKVAMILNGPWAMGDLFGGKEFQDKNNLGIAPIPAGPAGQGSPVGGHNYVIGKGSKNVDESYKFIEFLNNTDNQVKLAKELKVLPTRQSAYDNAELKSDAVVQAFKAQLDVARNRPVIPEGGQMFDDWSPILQAAVKGDKSAEQSMKDVEAAWNKLLKK